MAGWPSGRGKAGRREVTQPAEVVGAVSAGRFLSCFKKKVRDFRVTVSVNVSENLSECFSVRYEIFRLTRQSKRGRKISNARDSPRARDFRGRVRVRVPIKRA